MADIFISYSQKDRGLAKSLADFLAGCGYDLWWDYELVGGIKFRNEIKARLETAKAAIVIWTENSVESDWVVEEAEDAKYAKKLIATRVADLDYRSIPLGFRGVHTELVTEPERILKALETLGVKPSHAPSGPTHSPVVIDKRLDADAIAKAEQFAHWEFIKDSKDPAAFNGFIDLFPQSSFVALARIQLGRLAAEAWDKLRGRDDLDALRGFVSTFPHDVRAGEAADRIRLLEATIAEARSWSRIKDSSDIAAVEAHISLYPDGTNTRAAAAKLQKLKRDREIAVRWQQIADSTEPADFEAFLAAYSASPLAGDARARLDEVLRMREEEDWQAAHDAEVPAPLLGFLKQHPAGRHAQEALEALTALPQKIEDDAWDVVRGSDLPILFRGFVVAFPKGAHSGEAQAQLNRLTSTAPVKRPAPPSAPAHRRSETPDQAPASPAAPGELPPAEAALQDGIAALATTLAKTEYVSDAVALIEALGGTIVHEKQPFFGLFHREELVVTLFEQSLRFESEYDMAQWTLKEIVPRVLSR
jgi:hypothetical protein